ncbi:MAG: hypothetical protein N2692_00640 [Patescibacteria group bacterium]|jgi:hypothetical protein|nr:hypothetical protein [Patescibacteria group bacterium]
MAEILKKPPSQIKIRTLETDVEDLRKSGGGLVSGKILGRDFEEISQKINQEQVITFFPTDTADQEIKPQKKNLLFIIGGTILGLAVIVGLIYFLSHKPQTPKTSITPTPKAQYVSLLINFSGQSVYELMDLSLDDFEKILIKKHLLGPQNIQEIIFTKSTGDFITTDEFLRLLYNNFSGIASSEQPKFFANFSFIVYSDELSKKSIAYVSKINASGLSVFALSNLKSKFGLAFEKMIEQNPDLLTSQYLENIGSPTQPFLPKEIGPIKAQYIKFSTGNEFYYGFYNEYFIVATSQKAFEKILDLILIK